MISPKIIVTAPSRIHMGLIDLAGTTQRLFGGLGFCLKNPNTKIEISEGNNEICSEVHIDDRDLIDTNNVLNKVSKLLRKRFHINIIHRPPVHVGFGSKTSLLMGLIMGCAYLSECELIKPKVIKLSGRGGTSGIGVNAAFTGGFIVDVGHRNVGQTGFLPSSAHNPIGAPEVNIQLAVSSNWLVAVLHPEGHIYEKGEEIAFFRNHTPIPAYEVGDVLGCVYHGIVPAFRNADIEYLSYSLARLQEIGFKAREIESQSATVKNILKQLNNNAAVAAGMSSMGPVIYAIYDRAHRHTVESEILRIANEFQCRCSISIKPCNNGICYSSNS